MKAATVSAIVFAMLLATDDPANRTVGITFEKELRNGQRLLVEAKEVPITPRAAQTQAAVSGNIIWPQHRYEYAFNVSTAGGRTKQTLWTTFASDFGSSGSGDFRVHVFDAVVFDDMLVVCFHRDISSFATVIRSASDGRLIEMPFLSSNLLRDLSGAADFRVVGGRISGVPADGSLAVTFETADHQSVFFRLAREAGELTWMRVQPTTHPITEK